MWTFSGSSTAKPGNRRSVIGRPRECPLVQPYVDRRGETGHLPEYRGRPARRSHYPRISVFPRTAQPVIAASISCLYTFPPVGDEGRPTGGNLEAQPTIPDIHRHHQSITS